MRHYTVSQLAELSGISVRTLHHYDEIGLLAPAFVGENGYRYYGEEELLRLQQILLHREFGFPLREIGAILDDPAFDRIAALEAHRVRLELEAERYRRLVRTIDRTIAELKGPVTRGVTMKHADLYEGFAPGKQAEYERWLIERYGPQMERSIEQSRQKFTALSDDDRKAVLEQLAAIEADLAECCRQRVTLDSQALATVLERHREWVAYMWSRPCPPEAYAGLADLYLAHPDFRARYEQLEPGLCDYLTSAMKAHAERLTAHSP